MPKRTYTRDPRRIAAAGNNPELLLLEESWYPRIEMLGRLGEWDWIHTRNSKGSNPGAPDYLFSKPDGWRMVWIEFKLDGEQPTVMQLMWLNNFINHGLEAYIIWLPSDWDLLVDILQHGQRIIYGEGGRPIMLPAELVTRPLVVSQAHRDPHRRCPICSKPGIEVTSHDSYRRDYLCEDGHPSWQGEPIGTTDV